MRPANSCTEIVKPRRLLFKIGCVSTACGLLLSQFPSQHFLTLVFGIIGLGVLLGDAIATILGEDHGG